MERGGKPIGLKNEPSWKKSAIFSWIRPLIRHTVPSQEPALANVKQHPGCHCMLSIAMVFKYQAASRNPAVHGQTQGMKTTAVKPVEQLLCSNGYKSLYKY